MKPAEKGILINAIIGYLSENIKENNHKLANQNLYSDQKPFDAGDMFLKLAFMDDDEILKISNLIL